MKYIIISIFITICFAVQAVGQINFQGVNPRESTYGNKPFYAIQDVADSKPFGNIIFTPFQGGTGWEFEWTYNGAPQAVNYNADSSRLTVNILGDGTYTFGANRGGDQANSDFNIFFVHVPQYSINLSDVYNCTAVTIDAITDFQKPVYTVGGANFEGNNNVKYYLPGKTVPVEFTDYDLALSAKENGVEVSGENRNITVTITDRFGFNWESAPVQYTSVIPKADWSIELLNTVDVEGEAHAEMGQAPLEVVFHNNSQNAQAWEWYLYKDSSSLTISVQLADSLLDEMIRYDKEFNYTYNNSGEYKVQMIAINTVGANQCRDSIDPKYVRVLESLVEVGNVFTPNGDGINDIFKVRAISVKSFQGVILNRWGRKVYEWTDPESGWDGKINGKYASPGTYYYIVTATGTERNNPPKYVKKGALLLMR